MAIQSLTDLKALINSTIQDNTTNDISGSDVQTALINAIDTLDSLEGFINVHKANGQTTITAYGSKALARAAVPDDCKKEGVVIAYKISTGWLIEQNLDATAGTWGDDASWQTIGPVSVSQNTLTGNTEINIGGTLQGEALSIEKGVFQLTLMQGANVEILLPVGDYGYNTATKKVIFKDSQETYKSFNPNQNSIYLFEGRTYIYNGTDLVDDEFSVLMHQCILESGALDSSGLPVVDTTRIRTNNISGPHILTLPDGYVVHAIAYYDAITNEFDSIIYPQSQSVEFGTSGYVVKLVIRKNNGTDSISVNEFKDVQSLESLQSQIDAAVEKIPVRREEVIDWSILEQGSISQYGNFMDDAKRVRTRDFIRGVHHVIMPDGFRVFAIYYYKADTLAFWSYDFINDSVADVGGEGFVFRLVFSKSDIYADLTPDEMKELSPLESLNSRVDTITKSFNTYIERKRSSMVRFEINHNMIDISSILSQVQIEPRSVIMDSLYTNFDALVSAFPDYASKADAAEEVGLSYPRYANGIGTDDTQYLQTGAYKTYIYKFITTNTNTYSSINRKRKLFLIGGIHGIEHAAPINLFLFAHQLCNNFVNNPDLYKLRAAFDIYIIPCVNGYGLKHSQRGNANGVDLYRNFPCINWEEMGDSNAQGGSTYSGPSAGSEFETQLIMAQTNLIQPDICIDHHNYGDSFNELYCLIYKQSQIQLAMDASVDMAIAFQQNMPEYFGTNTYLSELFGIPEAAPKSFPDNILCTASRWWFEQGIAFPGTIEISNTLNWLHGQVEHGQDALGSLTFKVGEYAFRTQLLHYCQWTIDNTI